MTEPWGLVGGTRSIGMRCRYAPRRAFDQAVDPGRKGSRLAADIAALVLNFAERALRLWEGVRQAHQQVSTPSAPRARVPHPYRKGGKIVTIPLTPRTARAIDLAIRERLDGPIFAARTGNGWTWTAPDASCVRRVTKRAGLAKRITPRTTMCYDRARVSLDRHATYIVGTYLAGAAR